MKPLYTNEEFDRCKSRGLLPLECEQCGFTFFKKKHRVQAIQNGTANSNYTFCSLECKHIQYGHTVSVVCEYCGVDFTRVKSQLGLHNFCSQTCSGTYNNKHKTKGTRRSKLEIWLEAQLTGLFPDLDIHFNRKDTINSELDIYFPTLKLAIELNGIFHYEPIFGPEKLSKIQNNDQRKAQACYDLGIEFCTIDASQLKYFKPANAEKYLTVIINLLATKGVTASNRVEVD